MPLPFYAKMSRISSALCDFVVCPSSGKRDLVGTGFYCLVQALFLVMTGTQGVQPIQSAQLCGAYALLSVVSCT